MTEYLEIVVMTALLAAWIIILLTKLGAVEWMQVHGDKYLSRMASCSFCLSWWVCVVLMFGLVAWHDELRFMFVPLFATPITRMLV